MNSTAATRLPGDPEEDFEQDLRCHVLVVDDSPDNIELLSQALEGDEFVVETAADGQQALDKIAKQMPDVVLLDLMMPNVDGYEVLRRLRADLVTQDLPVIVVSARSQVEDVVHVLTHGATDYVTKPFHPQIVRARVLVHHNAKTSRDELKRVNRVKDEFLSIASHDLQAPVATVIGYARWILDGHRDELPAQVVENLNRIHRSAAFMHELIGDLLDMVRIEAGRMRLYPEQVSVRPVVTDAIERCSFAAQEKQIELINMVGEDLPVIEADPLKLQQVLTNLLSNGVKFSHPGARVTVKARCSADSIEIEVEDTGQGIPEEELSRLFTRFGRLSVRATGGERSTGLGLLITRQIVELHGGTVTVRSKSGQGSTFTIALPRRIARRNSGGVA